MKSISLTSYSLPLTSYRPPPGAGGLYTNSIVVNAANAPITYPDTTSDRLCCLSIILLEPTMPPRNTSRHSHQIGLKLKMNENASIPPVSPPIADVCVDTLKHRFIMAQNVCTASAATRIEPMKCGILNKFIK